MTEFGTLRVDEFLRALGSSEPTPGGGTAAAVSGAMGAALVEMVAALTLSKEKFVEAHPAIRVIAEAASAARAELLALAREDAEAYETVVTARRLPRETEDEKAARSRAISDANRIATEVPMRTAGVAVRLLGALPELVEKGNPSAVSDAGTETLGHVAQDPFHRGRLLLARIESRQFRKSRLELLQGVAKDPQRILLQRKRSGLDRRVHDSSSGELILLAVDEGLTLSAR